MAETTHNPLNVDPLVGFAPGLSVEGSLHSMLEDFQVETSPNLFSAADVSRVKSLDQ